MYFYYGTFEYPKNGGQRYQGKHEPIISKELFDKVQEQVTELNMKGEHKEFTLAKLMTCVLYGSGITAGEKFKKQANCCTHQSVYYGYCKFHDKNCKSGYLEEDLTEQLANLMDIIDLEANPKIVVSEK